MDCVPFKLALLLEARLLQTAPGCLVVYIAGRLYPVNAGAGKQLADQSLDSFRHKAATPFTLGEDVSNIDHVPVKPGIDHADWLIVSLVDEDVGKPVFAFPRLNAAADELACLFDFCVRPPDHVVGYIGVLPVRPEYA